MTTCLNTYFLRPYFWLLLSTICIHSYCFSDKGANLNVSGLPWFTGPLLTSTARVLPTGKTNLEPYLFWTITTGHYGDNWKPKSVDKFYQINPQLQVKTGLIKNIDISFTIQSFCSWTKGKGGSSFGDLPIGIDFQLFKGKKDDWLTYAKLQIQETFPTGRYQKLNPHKMNTDAGGQGAFSTQLGLGLSKEVEFSNHRFLNARCFISTALPTPVNVKGLNAYGGDPSTKGTAYPGISCNLDAGVEYTITDNWVFACDFQAQYSAKTRFKGRTSIAVGSPESIQLSLAPAIEYNWNGSLGIIIGPWFSLAGKNSNQFISLVAALNYYF